MTKISVAIDPFDNSAIRSIDRVHVMISIVQTMMANPKLCSSKDLPETLASLKRLLTLMELALRAYRHTDLVHSLSSAVSIGAEECRRLLHELISNLTNSRHGLSNSVLYSIRRYLQEKIGWQDSAISALDSKLRKSHSSFAACLLALGRAAGPELKRGQGQETLDELAKFYVQLEQESTSLRHIKADAVIVLDHLGRNLHVPMIFCTSSQDFHVMMSGYCRGVAGDVRIRRGDYRILNSEDDQVINPKEFATVLQPGMAVDMSIVFYEQAEERQGSEGHSCPRCQHANSRCTGWVTCAKCNGSFKISPEEESMVSPETEEHAGTDSIPNERYLFRKISIFQAAAGIGDRGFILKSDLASAEDIPYGRGRSPVEMSSPREGYYSSSAGKTRRSPQGQDSQSSGFFPTGQGGRPILPPISSGFPTSRSPVEMSSGSSPREGYYGSSAEKTRRNPQGQDSQSGGFFPTGQGGRPVLPPISSGFPTSRSPVPSQHQAYYPQPQRLSPRRSEYNAASYGRQWPSDSAPQQHEPAFAYYDQPDTRYTGNPYPSSRAPPGLGDQHEPRRLPPISIGSSGRRDNDWSSSSYVSGVNHVPFDDEIRSLVAGHPPQYPAYHLNQQAPYSHSQMPSDNTRNVAFPTAYTQSPY